MKIPRLPLSVTTSGLVTAVLTVFACTQAPEPTGSNAAADESQTLPDAPHCLPDLGVCEDLRDLPGPSQLDPNGQPLVFDCFKGCGASCKLQDKTTSQTIRCQDAQGQHRLLTYEVITGATHPFCQWHDTCYLECNIKYLDTDPLYSCCTAYCDFGCQNPLGFDDSCAAGKYDVPWWDFNITGEIAIQRVCGNVDDYVSPTCQAGPIPNAENPNWTTEACLAWATTAVGIDPGDNAPSTGTVTYTKLVHTDEWAAGACPVGVQPLP